MRHYYSTLLLRVAAPVRCNLSLCHPFSQSPPSNPPLPLSTSLISPSPLQ